MWRTCSLALFILTGCSDSSTRNQAFTANWDNVRQNSDIESLNRQIADLQEQGRLYGNELSALEERQASIEGQVSANAKIANDNGKLNDQRWNYVRQRLPQ